MNYEEHIVEGYFEYKEDAKEFSQRFLFIEYLEEWEQIKFKEKYSGTLRDFILADLYLHIHDENYATVQLYTDMIKRHEEVIEEFGR